MIAKVTALVLDVIYLIVSFKFFGNQELPLIVVYLAIPTLLILFYPRLEKISFQIYPMSSSKSTATSYRILRIACWSLLFLPVFLIVAGIILCSSQGFSRVDLNANSLVSCF